MLVRFIQQKTQRPWILVAYEEFPGRSQAMWKERELKKSKGKRLKWIKENKLSELTPRREGRSSSDH